MSDLLKLLQPKTYCSKIKRLCEDCKVETLVRKITNENNKNHLRKVIEIKEL